MTNVFSITYHDNNITSRIVATFITMATTTMTKIKATTTTTTATTPTAIRHQPTENAVSIINTGGRYWVIGDPVPGLKKKPNKLDLKTQFFPFRTVNRTKKGWVSVEEGGFFQNKINVKFLHGIYKRLCIRMQNRHT